MYTPLGRTTVSQRGNQDDEHVQLYQVLSPVVALRCLGHEQTVKKTKQVSRLRFVTSWTMQLF